MDDLHAMDYLMFAYLQTGRDSAAAGLLHHLGKIRGVAPGNEFASAYAIGAMPARYLLERGEWEEAATLPLPQPELLNRFPFAAAHIKFANGVGAARAGRLEMAGVAIEKLAGLRDTVKESKFQWWAEQIEIQHLSVRGWLAHAQQEDWEAERLFREAARLEDEAGTHPVTPGQILPAREQLGEMLLEVGRAADALVEFERTLESFPHRFRSHRGAVEAATRLGDRDSARSHAEELVRMTDSSGDRWKEIEIARAVLQAP